jgi:curved DNA-binding protein CbpA
MLCWATRSTSVLAPRPEDFRVWHADRLNISLKMPADTMDCFAVLGLPRAAVMVESALHRAYTEHSRLAHPDHGGSEAAASQVNAAFETLRSPEKRLKHLLELDGPEDAKAWRTVPLDDAMMSLFSGLGKAMEDTAKFLERKAKAGSALAKALLANEEMRHRETLERIGFEIEERREDMEAGLMALDATFANPDLDGWKQLAAMQARFAYLARWQAQVRERLLALM